MYGASMETKVGITGIVGVLGALLGVTGWLWVCWVLCLAADYVTGTVVACRGGQWSSVEARAGIWGKLSCMLVVLVTAVLDMAAGFVLAYIPALPIVYTAWLSPIVLVWYMLTEVGSILENLGELGVKLPPFLVRWVAVLQKKVGQAGSHAVPEAKWQDD
ncbi:MAG: phage holin family protein [Oscillospiraceae bacterium]|nr:phage holin family protein [Oscillospiraceae bacterium]